MCSRALIAFLAALCATAAAGAQNVTVPADHAGLIRLPGDADAVVVGNPAIADATLYDARTLFVTGKVHGRTNLIALNAEGQVLYTTDLAVTGGDRGTVQVFRGTARESYHCAPVCQAAPTVGDAPDWFSAVTGQQGANTPAGD